VDDGPSTVAGAVSLARGAERDGTTTIVATPHVDWAHDGIDAPAIRHRVMALQAQLDAAEVQVTIAPGAELNCTWAWENDDAELRALTLGGNGWLLVECPHTSTAAPGFTGIVRSIASRGHRILLAHPERCPLFQRSPELLGELVADGMLVQVTAGSLSGRFGRTVRQVAHNLVIRGIVHVVASDGHGERRPARIASELRAAGIGHELATWLGHNVPVALLAGEEIPARPAAVIPRVRRRLLARLAHRGHTSFTPKSQAGHY